MICYGCGNDEHSSVYQCKECGTMYCKSCAGGRLKRSLGLNLFSGEVGSRNQRCPKCNASSKVVFNEYGVVTEYTD